MCIVDKSTISTYDTKEYYVTKGDYCCTVIPWSNYEGVVIIIMNGENTLATMSLRWEAVDALLLCIAAAR